MLFSLHITCDIREEMMGGSLFLTFECRELSDFEIRYLSGHSSVVFMAEKKDGFLRPLPVSRHDYLPEDLPEVLKYKGKTSATFTRMMINTAAALSPFCHTDSPLVFLDPVCGKGTGCFCALLAGMNAVGIDQDSKAVREAADYFSRYLKFHRLKHERIQCSLTSARHAVPVTEFVFADTKEHYRSGNTLTLKLACADTTESAALFRREKAHIIAADLPYGIQHTPWSGSSPDSLIHFLTRVLPVWKESLVPGGVIALSFNTLTLPSRTVAEAVRLAGFIQPVHPVFSDLSHEVEQAVVRDVIFAFNTEEESII